MRVSYTFVTLANVGRQESNVQNNEYSTRTSRLDYTTNDEFSEWYPVRTGSFKGVLSNSRRIE